MKPTLSVVIACLNENEELLRTIQSIRDTAGDIPIRIVDDCSSTPIYVPPTFGNVTVFRSAYPLGVGPARHVAALRTNTDLILITDAHVRFKPGWLEAVLYFYKFVGCESTPYHCPNSHKVLCGQMLALSETNDDMAKHEGTYNGAYMVLENPAEELRYRILNAKWATDKPFQDLYPLSAMMGACYVMPRFFFLQIGGLSLLRGWGKDEELLSIKTVMAGGEILMFKKLCIGHKFKKGCLAPYKLDWSNLYFNVMMAAHVCFGQRDGSALCALLHVPETQDIHSAYRMLRDGYGAIASEHHRLKSVFKLTLAQYREKIGTIL